MSAGGGDRNVDPNEFAGRIQERTTRISGVDGSIRLNHGERDGLSDGHTAWQIKIELSIFLTWRARGSDGDAAVDSRNNPAGHGARQPQRCTNSDGFISHIQFIGIADGHHREGTITLEFENSDVGEDVTADDLGSEKPAI